MARTRRRWLRRLVMLGGLAALLGHRQRQLDANERRFDAGEFR